MRRALNQMLGSVQTAPHLDAERLIADAVKAVGADDFGPEALRVPLSRLVESLEDEARLSPLGRLITRTRLNGHLVNRLLLQQDEATTPAIMRERIRSPLFITGPPRTGTTILFHLLAQDPARLSPLAWKLQYPSPPPGHPARRVDRRVVAQKAREHFLYRVLPELRTVYRTGAVLPEECVVMKGHAFTTIMFSIAYHVPSYEAWLLDCDQGDAYRMHQRFLKHLQYGVPDAAWVLKSPEHMLSLDRLLETYPDACIVQTHRDVLDVLPSLSSLTCILRSLCSDRIDRHAAGRETATFWATALHRAAAYRAARPELSDQFLDVDFDDICNDPIAVVQTIYDRFGFNLSAEAEARMRRFLAANPRGRYGEHRYTLDAFGLDRQTESRRFATYRIAMGYARA